MKTSRRSDEAGTSPERTRNGSGERHVSSRAIVLTTLALLVLWGVSWAASYVPAGRFSLPIALAIAAVKAVLVLLYFMELATERFSIRATVISSAALVVVFVLLTALDVETRDPPRKPPSPVEIAPSARAPEARVPGLAL